MLLLSRLASLLVLLGACLNILKHTNDTQRVMTAMGQSMAESIYMLTGRAADGTFPATPPAPSPDDGDMRVVYRAEMERNATILIAWGK